MSAAACLLSNGLTAVSPNKEGEGGGRNRKSFYLAAACLLERRGGAEKEGRWPSAVCGWGPNGRAGEEKRASRWPPGRRRRVRSRSFVCAILVQRSTKNHSYFSVN